MYCCICFVLGLKHTFPFNNKHRATHNGAQLQIDTYMHAFSHSARRTRQSSHCDVTTEGNHHRRGNPGVLPPGLPAKKTLCISSIQSRLHTYVCIAPPHAAQFDKRTWCTREFLPVDFSRVGVGRSRRYCNTGPTRGEVGASSCIFSQFQKSV